MCLLVWAFRVWGCRVWDSRVVLPLRSGESEVDGTGDHKPVRCPSIGFCMILMQTLNSGDPLCDSFCGDLVSGGLLSRPIDFGFDRGRISGGLFSGGLVSRGLLSRANDFGCDRADACP